MSDDLMTLAEVAEYYRKPVGTLYVWRSRGTGPKGFRLGRGVVYRRSEVERYLEEQATESNDAA